MESNVPNPAEPDSTLMELVARYCDALLSPEEQSQMDQLLQTDENAQRLYGQYMLMHGELLWLFRCEQRDADADDAFAPPFAPDKPIAPPTLVGACYRTLGNLASLEWPVAYLIAAISVAIGITIGALVHVSQPGEYVGPHGPAHTLNPQLATPGPASIVARITAMVDCVWEDVGCVERSEPHHQTRLERRQASGAANQKSEITNHKSLLHLGDRLALRSGLLEITYDTGAKVILQGPVTYEVESPAGGYLSVGKLTAKLEKKSEVRGQRSEPANQKSEIQNHRSPDLCPLTSDLFAIRTPTALVTDLGTEFGVQVDKEGNTTSHVFRGSVEFKVLGVSAGKEGDAVVLHENESVETDRNGATETQSVAVRRVHVDPKRFARRVMPTPNTLDLLDIVAGGNGTGHHRERGIDPSTGMEDPVFMPGWRGGDRQYRRVAWHKLIDGVFVPSGGDDPVVVDSVGHTFGGFPRTGGNTWGSIWARGAEVKPIAKSGGQEKDHKFWVYAMGRGKQFTPNDRGLLGMLTNTGITFDLEAMRTLYRGALPTRFRTVAGVPEAHCVAPPDIVQLAEIWVLIDGHLKFSRAGLRPQNGPVKVDIALGPKDRFLTLVATYGGKESRNFDWVVFGDPVLEMTTGPEQELAPERTEVSGKHP